MNVRLAPYSKYKDSGVPWLGEVPAHWEVLPNRALFAEVKERNYPDEQMLSVTISKGVIRQQALLADSSKKDSSNQDKSAYKLVCPRDIAYNKMRGWQGAIGISDFRGIVSPAYVVERLRNDQNPRYFHHLYRTPMFAKEAERWSYGITSDMWSLRPEHFKMIYTALPPFPEQSAIVRFINHFGRRFNWLIRTKRRLIELLNEQKQAIIRRAVTRGLDPNVRLKPSGIDWLGDIPEHWAMMRGRACYREKKIVLNTGLRETTVLSLSYGQIVVKPVEKLHGLVPASFETYQIVDPGDIVIRPTDLQNDWKSLRFGLSRHRGIITSAYMCFHTTDLMVREHGYLLLHTYDLKKVFYGLGSGLRQNLSWEDFKYLPCLVPPQAEQSAIARFLDEATADINKAIARAQREIDLLREYRTRLIADVVAGKLDVRGVELPKLDETEMVGDREIGEEAEVDEAGDTEEVADGEDQ